MLKYFEKPTYNEGEIIRLTKIYDFDDKSVYFGGGRDSNNGASYGDDDL
jgi:hypothetical protein